MTRRRRVLVVDDEPDIQLYLVSALEDAGFEAYSLNPGESVEDAVARLAPDVISLDLMMPRRSGIAVYRSLRQEDRFRTIPVVVVSGMMQGKDFLDEGFRRLIQDPLVPAPDAYVEKPVVVRRLVETLNRLAPEEAP